MAKVPPGRVADPELVRKHLAGLARFVEGNHRDQVLWMAEVPSKRFDFPKLIKWLDMRHIEKVSYAVLTPHRFAELVGDQVGIVVPFDASDPGRCVFMDPPTVVQTACDSDGEGDCAFLIEDGVLAALFQWEDTYVDESYVRILRRRA